VSYLLSALRVLPAYLSYFLGGAAQVLQLLLGRGGIEDVVCVQLEEGDELPEDGSVALLVAVVVELLLQDLEHALVEVADLGDGGEEEPPFLLAEHSHCLDGLLDVGDVFLQAGDVPLLPVDQLEYLHFPLLPALGDPLLELFPAADQLEPEPQELGGLVPGDLRVLLADYREPQNGVVPVHLPPLLILLVQKLQIIVELPQGLLQLPALDLQNADLPLSSLKLTSHRLLDDTAAGDQSHFEGF
jgi:hypothetical protein